MVALHDALVKAWMGGGKSELHRAGWSVIRTVPGPARTGDKESATERIPPCGIGVTAIPQGKGERAR